MGEALDLKAWKQKVIDSYRLEFVDILEKLQDPVIQKNAMRYQFLFDRGQHLAARIDELCEGLSFIVHLKR